MKKDTSSPRDAGSLFGSASHAQDGFDFLKRMWGGGMALPGMMTPTTDLNELEKRITDLKTVEQWLNLNLTMLRATIQGLEVQHGTLGALQAFGNSLHSSSKASSQPSKPSTTAPESQHDTQAIEDASTSMVNTATAWWSLMQEQFNSMTQGKSNNTGTPQQNTSEPSQEEDANKTAQTQATQTKVTNTEVPKTATRASSKKTSNKTHSVGKPSHDV